MSPSPFCGRQPELAHLLAAFERLSAEDARPQIVALLAESGFGKTRLIQEFYHQLSTRADLPGHPGYWPDRLSRQGDDLRINPDLGACNNAAPIPFLWWGIRMRDPGARNQTVGSSAIIEANMKMAII